MLNTFRVHLREEGRKRPILSPRQKNKSANEIVKYTISPVRIHHFAIKIHEINFRIHNYHKYDKFIKKDCLSLLNNEALMDLQPLSNNTTSKDLNIISKDLDV